MDKKDNGGPAFPIPHQPNQEGYEWNAAGGMSMRDWFAGLALQGLCANKDFLDQHLKDCISQEIEDPDMIRGLFANTCYLFADAMIKEK